MVKKGKVMENKKMKIHVHQSIVKFLMKVILQNVKYVKMVI